MGINTCIGYISRSVKMRATSLLGGVCRYLTLLLFVSLSRAAEFTFELPDSSKECFYEHLLENTKCTIEFQVLQGGNYDVDMTLMGPNGNELYRDYKKQYDTFTFTSDTRGEYEFCFSNEFSTFSHKMVYVDITVGDGERALLNGPTAPPMTAMEKAARSIHQSLTEVEDYQTHYKLREFQGRQFAEDLNDGVLHWSVGETLLVVVLSVGQVLVLRSFFSGRK